MGRVQRGHQGKHPDGEKHGEVNAARNFNRGNREYTRLARPSAQQQKRGGLIEVVDRAIVDGQAALGHGERVQAHPQGEQEHS